MLKTCYGQRSAAILLLICRMKWKINHVAFLLSASTLAMIGLVIFQYKWIAHSRKLSDEIFTQRASMALCSTLQEYSSSGTTCNLVASDKNCNLYSYEDSSTVPQNSIVHNEDFKSDLRKTLDFYNIDLNYKVTQCTAKPASNDKNGNACCVVNFPNKSDVK